VQGAYGNLLQKPIITEEKTICRSQNRSFGERFPAVHCVICTKPVRLGEYEVTDLGEPAHESCLVEQLLEEIKKHKVAPANERVA